MHGGVWQKPVHVHSNTGHIDGNRYIQLWTPHSWDTALSGIKQILPWSWANRGVWRLLKSIK